MQIKPADREYEALRREIEKTMEMQHSLYNFLYVGVVAVLAWGINNHNPLVCLLAYCIIFPSFYIMLSYNSGIFRIGAYIFVYYDDYSWEKRLHKINTDETYKELRYISSYKVPFLFTSVMCTALSIIVAYQKYSFYSITYIIIAVLSLLLFISFCIYACSQKKYDDFKTSYINAFQKMKESENTKISQSETEEHYFVVYNQNNSIFYSQQAVF